jgi:hypothetical protein
MIRTRKPTGVRPLPTLRGSLVLATQTLLLAAAILKVSDRTGPDALTPVYGREPLPGVQELPGLPPPSPARWPVREVQKVATAPGSNWIPGQSVGSAR